MGGVHGLSTQVGQVTMLLRIENYFQAHDLLSKTITENWRILFFWPKDVYSKMSYFHVDLPSCGLIKILWIYHFGPKMFIQINKYLDFSLLFH